MCFQAEALAVTHTVTGLFACSTCSRGSQTGGQRGRVVEFSGFWWVQGDASRLEVDRLDFDVLVVQEAHYTFVH